MQMTNGEIVASYRQAKNKKEQVKILAELNACKIEEITKILVEGGVAPNQLPRNRENKAPEKNKPTYTAPVVEVTADTASTPYEQRVAERNHFTSVAVLSCRYRKPHGNRRGRAHRPDEQLYEAA